MNEYTTKTLSRRSLVKGAAALAGIAVVSLLGTGGKAFAAGKLTKESVKYQDQGKEGKDCDDCLQFIPGKSARDKGACKLVEGAVSPHGYCLAFTPKPKRG